MINALILAACIHSATSAATIPRPPHTDHARLARWFVHASEWGVVSTVSVHLGGVAFGNAVSVSDGARGGGGGGGTGRLLFYLSPLDATAQDLASNGSATLTLAFFFLSFNAVAANLPSPRVMQDARRSSHNYARRPGAASTAASSSAPASSTAAALASVGAANPPPGGSVHSRFRNS